MIKLTAIDLVIVTKQNINKIVERQFKGIKGRDPEKAGQWSVFVFFTNGGGGFQPIGVKSEDDKGWSVLKDGLIHQTMGNVDIVRLYISKLHPEGKCSLC